MSDPVSSELQQMKQQWLTQHIVNYAYTFENGCFCSEEVTQPVRIEVRNGVRASIRSVTGGQPVNEEYFAPYDTIPKLFDMIQAAIAKKPAQIVVRYDPKIGFPTDIFIDPDKSIADEETRLNVYGFEIISKP